MDNNNRDKSPTHQEEVNQNEQTLKQADQIVKTALGGVQQGNDGGQGDDGDQGNDSDQGVNENDPHKGPMLGSVGDQFKGLPMRELISAPLIAAAEAQHQLASTAWEFYERIAFDKDGDNKKTRLVEFTVNRPIEQGGKMVMAEQKVQAPFIGLVPIPSLLIDHIDVDFQMEVTASETSKSNFSSDVSTSISSGWFVKAEVSGKVSSSRENTRSTNQTAKYQVHVAASQQPQTEGLSKLMDIMASCIEPMPTGKVTPASGEESQDPSEGG